MEVTESRLGTGVCFDSAVALRESSQPVTKVKGIGLMLFSINSPSFNAFSFYW
jgi:hypothetical protein